MHGYIIYLIKSAISTLNECYVASKIKALSLEDVED